MPDGKTAVTQLQVYQFLKLLVDGFANKVSLLGFCAHYLQAGHVYPDSRWHAWTGSAVYPCGLPPLITPLCPVTVTWATSVKQLASFVAGNTRT